MTNLDTLRAALTVEADLTRQIEQLHAHREEVRARVIELCPIKPGTTAEDYTGALMWVTRVQLSDVRGRPTWTYTGRKLRKDGQPHATAWAFGGQIPCLPE